MVLQFLVRRSFQLTCKGIETCDFTVNGKLYYNMARPHKQGLDYFNVDVDIFNNEKIEFVSARFGLKGEAIVLRLLCRIYKNGYFFKLDDDATLLFCRSAGDMNSIGLVKDVVNELIKRDFFNKVIFDRFKMLTSISIQKRYAKICTDAKRKDWFIESGINLLGNKPALIPEETKLTPDLIPQIESKEKETKENETMGEISIDSAPLIPLLQTLNNININSVKSDVKNLMELDISFARFQEFIIEEALEVSRMKTPFTLKQYNKIVESIANNEFSKETLKDVLRAMGNHRELNKKYSSAYVTLINWIKLRQEKKQPNGQIPKNEPTVDELLKAAG